MCLCKKMQPNVTFAQFYATTDNNLQGGYQVQNLLVFDHSSELHDKPYKEHLAEVNSMYYILDYSNLQKRSYFPSLSAPFWFHFFIGFSRLRFRRIFSFIWLPKNCNTFGATAILTSVAACASFHMPCWVTKVNRIVADIGISVPTLGIPRTRYNAIRLDKTVKIRIIRAGNIAPGLKYLLYNLERTTKLQIPPKKPPWQQVRVLLDIQPA